MTEQGSWTDARKINETERLLRNDSIAPVRSNLFSDTSREHGGAMYAGKKFFFKRICKTAGSSTAAELRAALTALRRIPIKKLSYGWIICRQLQP